MQSSDQVAYGRIGALLSWANTEDRTARTARGRAAFERLASAEHFGKVVIKVS